MWEKLKKSSLILCLAVYLSSCIQFVPNSAHYGQSECNFRMDWITGSSVKWDMSTFPISFYVHDSVPPKAYYNFVSSLDHWNAAWLDYLDAQKVEGPPLFKVVGDGELFSTLPKDDGYNVLFFANDFSRYGESIMQAVTIIKATGFEIKDTDIVVNAQHFKYFYDEDYEQDVKFMKKNIFADQQKRRGFRGLAQSKNLSLTERIKIKLFGFFHTILKLLKIENVTHRDIATPNANVPRGFIDFPSLIIHELGHVPGLSHTDTVDANNGFDRFASRSDSSPSKRVRSVMEPKLPSGFSRRRIGAFDLGNVFCEYYNKSKKNFRKKM